LGGEASELSIAEPASIDLIRSTEGTLGNPLPDSLRRVLLDFSSAVSIRWRLPRDFELPEALREIFGGELIWDVRRLVEVEQERASWQQNVFPNAGNAYDVVWHNKLGFMTVPNGDVIAFDLAGGSDPPVVYLSHDDGEGHGYRLGDNFADFIDRWSSLGCPGPEDWQMMPFVESATSGLLPDCENAKQWRQLIGLA
jgi:hypothetical protein